VADHDRDGPSRGPEAIETRAPASENEWRIECSEGANSDGTIVFRVTRKGGAPIEVTVAIKDGTGKNSLAHRIRDAFDDFSLELVSNSVKSVRINLDRE